MTCTASFLCAASVPLWPVSKPFARRFMRSIAPLILFVYTLLVNSGAAMAQMAISQRTLPPDIQLAEMVVVQPPIIRLNDSAERLAPGARIYGPDQLLKLSATLVNQPLKVAFTRDSLGLVKQVWILTEAERKRLDAKK
jgi:hypothetical protein